MKILSNLRLVTKLLIAFAITNVLMVAIAMYASISLDESKAQITALSSAAAEKLTVVMPTLRSIEASSGHIVHMGSHANHIYAQTRKLIREVNDLPDQNDGPQESDTQKSRLQDRLGTVSSRIQEIRELIDQSKRSTDESGGNFTALEDQIRSLGEVSQVSEKIEAIIRRLKFDVAIALAFLLLLSLTGALLVSRAMTRPLDVVMARARRIGAGDLEEDDSINRLGGRHDEVGELATTQADVTRALRGQRAELDQQQRELEDLAYYDTLTGLPNRRLFRQQLDQAVDLAGDTATRVGCCSWTWMGSSG